MIEVLNESGEVPSPVPESELADLGRHVLDQLRVNPRVELTITLVDTDTMANLHERWMDLPGPTDVMSFPMDELRPGGQGSGPVDDAGEAGVLGDVVLCPPVAREQAQKAGHAVGDEILLLTTHGILHLLGFDHAEETERREMFDLQRTLLLTFLAHRGRTTRAADDDVVGGA
ncbi:Metal-dependent hydrolase YbeY, involved in rRNA and/or ribosome maturation and assembly [Serinicoccus hydrothermalis]|uniref:Endoribonuclease YbeY n=1 Tax=Serinicoccus hydrothermalis TaxID=1758689 RepID=A0A1B1N7V0_9MICO|nr:rRNA maturation RNase YbeY [Serinicoccus hydrothermalis]ANS77465.1 Metal-dependent hydrolase YbeY, involved in rRNA and/or ribosome maturation and assembly [Serinicoccus hydrothermalis]